MKRISVILLTLVMILCLLPTSALASDATTYSVQMSGSFSNPFTLTNIPFDPNSDFDGDTTQYKYNLALSAELASTKAFYPQQIEAFLKEKMGCTASSVHTYDTHREGKEEYLTGYTVGTRKILRNGNSCTLMIVAISTSSVDSSGNVTGISNSIYPDFDFLNYEEEQKNQQTPDYTSTKALTFTKSAEKIFGNIETTLDTYAANQASEDFLVWVIGQSRGGAVGNYLSKLLVDKYGTPHVTGYLSAVPNVDKDAATQNSAKYDCIFNLINPDDVVTYVPFGTGDGSAKYANWGYARWGVDVTLQITTTASEAVYARQQQNYKAYTKNCSQDDVLYIDGIYYTYAENEDNGRAIKSLIDTLVVSVPSPKDYYTGATRKFTYYDANGKVNSSFYLMLRTLATDAMSAIKSKNTTNLLALYNTAKNSFNNKCDVQPLLKFALKHVTGYTSLDACVKYMLGGSILNAASMDIPEDLNKLALREAAMGHMPETYLSWLLAASDDPLLAAQSIRCAVAGDTALDPAAVTVLVAYYDADGHMTRLDAPELIGSNREILLEDPTGAKHIRIYYLDQSGMGPVQQDLSIY